MEGEGQSRWRVGWQRLMLVVVCCGCVVVWLCCACVLFTHFVEQSTQPMLIYSPSLTQKLMQNCSPQAVLTNQHTIRIPLHISKLGWQLGLAFVLRGGGGINFCALVYDTLVG